MTSPAASTSFRHLAGVAAAILLGLALAAGGCAVASPPTVAPVASAPVASSAVAALPAEVSVDRASAMRDAGAFMLDVREPDEWAAGHIPGATLIPLGQLEARASEVPTGAEVVVVCRSGNRSATGRDILLAAGHPAVTSMAGGMNDWAAAGYPTETGE
jgi:rhodanese-related sulfurtransferase